MDTRGLYPQSNRQQKLTLRRRCRSETLPQMGHVTIVGTPIDLDDPIELRRKSSSHHQTVFRNRIHSKHHSPGVLRNQESAKNIFSLRENRRNTTTASAVQLKTNTKENISVEYHDVDGSKDICLREFELYKDRAAKTNVDFLNINKHQRIEKDDWESYAAADDCYVDTHKRRARARSESEPHEIYLTKTSPSKSDSMERNNLVLKRSRDDRPHISRNNFGDTVPTLLPLPDQFSATFDAKSKPPPKPPSAVKSPQFTKLVNNYYNSRPSTPCNSPRYTGNKSLNGNIRRLRSKSLKCKAMVVANPVPSQRCVTPDTESNHLKDECEEDSDGGGSSLEDDVDFGDVGEEDFNDSFSDSEDYNATVATEPPNINKKLSEANLLTDSVIGSRPESGPLSASLFPHVPPYITFADHAEKGPAMPAAITKVLKWKLTTITPIVIRKVLANTGFRLLRKTNDWMGVWGKHMKSPCFKTIRSYQKINHIPGSFQIGRKDRIWRNLQTQMAKHGKKEFGFMPRTFVIPADLKQLHRLWPAYSHRNCKWIIKPPASARGTGIKVVNQWSQIPKRKPLIVQRYIDRPLLIDGSKFDLRLYVLVTSINPLRVYMHTDGLARFASVKYSAKSDTLNDRYMHLTNYSINKLSNNYAKNEDASACQGHKWTLKSLWTHLAGRGINTELLWAALRDLVLRTILAGENSINHLTKVNIGSKYNCFELFGIDVILNSELIPWLLEVNISPSLHSASPLDLHVKGPLVQALLNTAMFQVPPRIPLAKQNEIITELGLDDGLLCHDKRIFTTSLSKGDKLKHNHFTNRSITRREDYLDEILKNLTADDIRCLLITEDELARSAPLERIFPSAQSHKYLQYIESPRYYNRLLDAWEHRYGGNRRDKGIALIRKFCEDKVHLTVPPQPAKKDSESNVSDTGAEAKVQISDDESDQKKLNGINNIEATITTVNGGHITNDDSEIQYFNGHKTNHHHHHHHHHHAVNGVTATD